MHTLVCTRSWREATAALDERRDTLAAETAEGAVEFAALAVHHAVLSVWAAIAVLHHEHPDSAGVARRGEHRRRRHFCRGEHRRRRHCFSGFRRRGGHGGTRSGYDAHGFRRRGGHGRNRRGHDPRGFRRRGGRGGNRRGHDHRRGLDKVRTRRWGDSGGNRRQMRRSRLLWWCRYPPHIFVTRVTSTSSVIYHHRHRANLIYHHQPIPRMRACRLLKQMTIAGWGDGTMPRQLPPPHRAPSGSMSKGRDKWRFCRRPVSG